MTDPLGARAGAPTDRVSDSAPLSRSSSPSPSAPFAACSSPTSPASESDASSLSDLEILQRLPQNGVRQNSAHLCVPESDKLWLVSPPGSPPVGWTSTREHPPNSQTHFSEDLIDALSELQSLESFCLDNDRTPSSSDHVTSDSIFGGQAAAQAEPVQPKPQAAFDVVPAFLADDQHGPDSTVKSSTLTIPTPPPTVKATVASRILPTCTLPRPMGSPSPVKVNQRPSSVLSPAQQLLYPQQKQQKIQFANTDVLGSEQNPLIIVEDWSAGPGHAVAGDTTWHPVMLGGHSHPAHHPHSQSHSHTHTYHHHHHGRIPQTALPPLRGAMTSH